MSSSDSSSDSSFFSSSAAAAPPAAAPPAAAAAGAAPPPTLVMRSSIFFLSKSLAKRPGQYGSISTPAALTMVAILSAYLFETQTQKRKKQVLEAVSARACVYAVEKVKRATSPQKQPFLWRVCCWPLSVSLCRGWVVVCYHDMVDLP